MDKAREKATGKEAKDHEVNRDKAHNKPFEGKGGFDTSPDKSFGGVTNEGTSPHLGEFGEQVYKEKPKSDEGASSFSQTSKPEKIIDPIRENKGDINTSGTSSSKQQSKTSGDKPITQKVTEKVMDTASKLKDTVIGSLHKVQEKIKDVSGKSSNMDDRRTKK